MVLGERNITLYGKGYIEDILCGKTFRISPNSFYQVNPVQTERLYRKAVELAGLTGKERVMDAYCGIGTIGMAAADQAGRGYRRGAEPGRCPGRHQQRKGQRREEYPLHGRGMPGSSWRIWLPGERGPMWSSWIRPGPAARRNSWTPWRKWEQGGWCTCPVIRRPWPGI